MPTNSETPGGKVRRVRRGGTKKAASAGAGPAEKAPIDEVVSVDSSSKSPSPLWATTSVRTSDITTFLRQLIMMLEAGTPLLRSLKTLSTRGKATLRQLVKDIAQSVEMGNPLWQAFQLKDRYFDQVFVNLIKASEASGTLVTVLQRVVEYREKRELLIKRVRGAMLYPLILVIACFGVVLFIAKIVVPEFETMFAKFNVDLPPTTEVFLGGAKVVGNYWWVALVAVAALTVAYKGWYVRDSLRRLSADRFKLRIPIIGVILRKNAIVEFTRTFSLLLRSGLSMMATLELVEKTVHNRAFAQVIKDMRDSVERGAGLEPPLRAAEDIVPPVVTDMIVTGEESGRLDSISEQVADTFEEEVNIAIATLGEALQPILTVFIGGMVILLMLAVFQPLIAMLNQLGAGGV